MFYNRMSFKKMMKKREKHLYAGTIPNNSIYDKYDMVGLALDKKDNRHILHDITHPIPLPSNCIDIFQAEDVFEHIEYNKISDVFDEIWRVLKPGGVFRLSVPDYRCREIYNRCLFDNNGRVVFDPFGGGYYSDKVGGGGHVWFPIYESVLEHIKKSKFKEVKFYHYYDETGKEHRENINYDYGYIQRTPENENKDYVISIVVDCIK